MSQAKVTDFFLARRRVPEQQAAKRRKIVLDTEELTEKMPAQNMDKLPTQNTVKKSLFNDENEETNNESTFNAVSNRVAKSPLKECASLKAVEENVEVTSEVVTSALDDHVLSTPLSTPSTRDAEGLKPTRRRSKGFPEVNTTPSTEGAAATPAAKFTIGSGPTKSAKKKLQLPKSDTKRQQSLIPFTKLGALSPKKRPHEVAKIVQSPNKFRFEKLGNVTPKKHQESPSKPEEFTPILSPFKPPTTPSKKTLDINATKKNLNSALSNAKKLTPSEVKAKLGKVGKLSDLKERLQNLNAASQKLKQFPQKVSSAPLLSEPPVSLKFEISVPASPAKKLHSPSPVKASPRKVPAYQRFHTLAQPLDRTLPLPLSYKAIAEFFRCCDTVVAMMHNRQEIITFNKLKKGVEEMTKKNFGEKFLRQIKCVFPQAYHYTWEKIVGKFGNKKSVHELQISANLSYKRDLLSEFSDKPDNKVQFAKLGPELLVERRTIFHNSLLQMVKDHHKDFLASLNPPIVVEDNKLTKWHRDFDVDICPEIDEEVLPTKPVLERLTTASEVLEKARDIFDINPKLSDALVNVADKVAVESEAAPEDPVVIEQEIPKHLKGLNPKLIEKIRAKEAAKAKREMTRDSALVKRITQLKRLPNLARMLRSLFITEQKAALTMDFTSRKIASSHKGFLSPNEVDEDLRLLSKLINWATFHVVQKIEYIKINKHKDINSVCKMLDDILEEHEKK